MNIAVLFPRKFVLEVFRMCSDLFELIKNFQHLGSKFNKSVHTCIQTKVHKSKTQKGTQKIPYDCVGAHLCLSTQEVETGGP